MSKQEPVSVSHISLNIGPDSGVDDLLVYVRVIPAGKNGNTVLGKTLAYGEPDPEDVIIIHPGEKLLFPKGNLKIHIQYIEQKNFPEFYGYAPITNLIWTWFHCGASSDLELFRFFWSAARRLDRAHNLCSDTLCHLGSRPGEPFIQTRARMNKSLGYAELMCVAFHQAIKMIKSIPSRFSIPFPVPKDLEAIYPALKDIRNAIEHIDARVFSIQNQSGAKHPDALTIFDQSEFGSCGILRYADHSMDIRADVISALISARQFLFDVTVKKTGSLMTLEKDLEYPVLN